MPFAFIAQLLAFALTVGAIVSAASWLFLWWRRRRRIAKLLPRTTRIMLAARKNLSTAVVLSRDLATQSGGWKLESWLLGLGFKVTGIDDPEVFDHSVNFTPTVTAVDCDLGPAIVKRVEDHFENMKLNTSATVVFFNTDRPAGPSRGILKNARFMGRSFTREDLMRLIIPLVVAEEVAARGDLAMEGRLSGDSLGDLLQYVETGGRTGMLTVRDTAHRVLGVVGFIDGVVRHARTVRSRGADAVVDLLGVRFGYFQFRVGEFGFVPNCSVPPTFALLQRAQLVDEARRGGTGALPPLVVPSPQ